MATIHLTYHPSAQGDVDGWYLPGDELAAWLAALAAEPSATTQLYLAPRSMADSTAVGLIALRRDEARSARSVPMGAIPLRCVKDRLGHSELWLPLLAGFSIDVPENIVLAKLHVTEASIFVWLTPDGSGCDRLIGLTAQDEIDLSGLIKPPISMASLESSPWSAPPVAPHLPDQVLGLAISPALIPPNPFESEQHTIGGQSDDIMSLDDEGRPQGGGLGAMAGRAFRKSLEKIVKVIQRKANLGEKNSDAEAEPTAGKSSAGKPSKPARKQAAFSNPAAAGLFQHLHKMLEGQREKQLKKLLALMARDPDRALKYAVPMAGQGAPRGVSQPGAKLSANNVDFSLTSLFGGGQPVDAWAVSDRLQANLIEAYREQAQREVAAGRYRRAAYIYAHLLGDLNSAAIMLEKGKFFMEACEIYKHLNRLIDQARCLRRSGQLTEAAAIYEQLENFEMAAEMWSSVGNQPAARNAYERACEAALKRREILIAVSILEKHLEDTARAEALLWQQWPRGHQVMECTKLAFQRLAEQGRMTDAQRLLDEIVGRSSSSDQTLLARLCSDLYKSFPDRELRVRAEDQCRQSAVNNLSGVSSVEFKHRMELLGGLHPDDLLFQRDARRLDRHAKETELQLQPEPAEKSKRGTLQVLSSLRLADGHYCAAMMIGRQLFTMAELENTIQFSRHAGLVHDSPIANHCRSPLDRGGVHWQPCCHVRHDSDPLQVVVGYWETPPEPMLLTSPLGGDDFWILNHVGKSNGLLAGVGNDGSDWYWDSQSLSLTKRLHGIPTVTDFSGAVKAIMLKHWYGADDDILGRHMNAGALAQRQGQLLVQDNQPFIAHFDTLMSLKDGAPVELATLGAPIRWVTPSLPRILPRRLVATTDGLWMVSHIAHIKPELVQADEHFTKAAILPGGYVAATTKKELLLFRRGAQAVRLIDRQELQTSRVVAILSLSAETIGVLHEHGVLQRWRIGY